ncbi:hypothetical protein [Bizionia psychrotolerans]|uniref:hypothetical protein n=1 Tax=Bizionia psychrotolerans TaxID=1492901 RepID=UPI0006515004|nr:hypothetical protein [Bizionia psychrotolerans]
MTEIIAAFMIFLASLASSPQKDYSTDINDYEVIVEYLPGENNKQPDADGKRKITFKAKEGSTLAR